MFACSQYHLKIRSGHSLCPFTCQCSWCAYHVVCLALRIEKFACSEHSQACQHGLFVVLGTSACVHCAAKCMGTTGTGTVLLTVVVFELCSMRV